jgi:dTDP-4-dehydrorhamnose 3,5-epimerase
MEVTETHLEGCFLIQPKIFEDKRGFFLESFNKNKFEEKTNLKIEFIQDNVSVSKRGVLRGLHFQRGKFAQSKLVRVVRGEVLDVVVDVRRNSKTYGQSFSSKLSGENHKQIFIPKGFLHGFSVLRDNTIFEYKCDAFYNKESESGVIYNDRDLNIDWIVKKEEIIISEKDLALKNFKTLF